MSPSGTVVDVTSGAPSAALSHSVTQPSAHAYTPSGAVSQFDNRPAYKKVVFCQRAA